MAFELLAIIGVYAFGAACIHVANGKLTRPGSGAPRHYVLHTLNDGRYIEWVVRSLVLFYWLQGRQVLITVIDEGSTDETLAIVGSLARSHTLLVRPRGSAEADSSTGGLSSNKPSIGTTLTTSAAHTEWIHINLRNQEDLQKLPISCPVR